MFRRGRCLKLGLWVLCASSIQAAFFAASRTRSSHNCAQHYKPLVVEHGVQKRALRVATRNRAHTVNLPSVRPAHAHSTQRPTETRVLHFRYYNSSQRVQAPFLRKPSNWYPAQVLTGNMRSNSLPPPCFFSDVPSLGQNVVSSNTERGDLHPAGRSQCV